MTTSIFRLPGIATAFAILFLVASLNGCSKARTSEKKLPLAPYINVSRLDGEWNIVARIPTYFDPLASDMSVQLKGVDTGKIKAHWSFKKNSDSEKVTSHNLSIQTGLGADSTKWVLSLFWFVKMEVQVVEFSGDMKWIILASKDYRYLWILSRGGALDSNLMKSLLERVEEIGFDMSAIVPR